MKAVRVSEKSASAEALLFDIADIEVPAIGRDQCLVEVRSSSVNPSDVKGLLGVMPYLVWPRTPGRDFAGVVVDGPASSIGKEVWGTGGDLGMSRDGGHAEYVVIEAAAIREKPANMPIIEAGGVGVSFTCAYLGIIAGAQTQAGETVAVLGASGKTGEAAVQLASAAGARVIAVERQRGEYLGFAKGPVEVLDLRGEDLLAGLMDRTDGLGVDVIFNSVGSPYFETASKAMAKKGRQIIISTFENEVPIDLKLFYRGNHRLVGVSNSDNDHIDSGAILTAMRDAFEAGDLRPFPAGQENVFALDNAGDAYRTVLAGTVRERMFIAPKK